jgi:hypothetical protein
VGAYLWKPLPSMRTTIHVFGRSRSGCSKAFTYSYLRNLISTPVRVRLWSTYFEFAIFQCCGGGGSYENPGCVARFVVVRLPRSEARVIPEFIGHTHVSNLLFKPLEVSSNTRVLIATPSLLFIYSSQESDDHQDLGRIISRDPLSFSIVWNLAREAKLYSF